MDTELAIQRVDEEATDGCRSEKGEMAALWTDDALARNSEGGWADARGIMRNRIKSGHFFLYEHNKHQGKSNGPGVFTVGVNEHIRKAGLRPRYVWHSTTGPDMAAEQESQKGENKTCETHPT